jgi:hypothetical protein
MEGRILHHQQKANNKHLSAVLVKQNMTSEEVELSLTLCVKCRSAIHPATRLISITEVSPLLHTRCLSLGHRSSPIHHPSPPPALSDHNLRLRSRIWRRVMSFQWNLYPMLILIFMEVRISHLSSISISSRCVFYLFLWYVFLTSSLLGTDILKRLQAISDQNKTFHAGDNFLFVIYFYFITLCVLLIFILCISYLIAACDWCM